MNRSNLILILSALIIAVIANSIYIVNEKEKALVTQFGEVIKPDVQVGIHFKIPLIQSVRKFDARLQSLDEEPNRILTVESKYLLVDSFVKYNTFCKKCWGCFYCQSKCCGKTKTNKEFRKYTKDLYTDNILYNEENVSPRKKRLNRNSDKFYCNVNDYDIESNQPISNQNSENDMEKENLLSPKMVSLMDPQMNLFNMFLVTLIVVINIMQLT